MNTSLILLALHVGLSLGLWYSVFCRAVKSDCTVRADVRAAFVVLGTAALASALAPFLWGLVPSWPVCALLAGFVLVHWVTARHWSNGVPYAFLRNECRPRRRAGDRGCDLAGSER